MQVWWRGISVCMALAVIGGVVYLQMTPETTVAVQTEESGRPDNWPGHDEGVLFSAPGVTEPSTRTLSMICEIPGTIRQVHVRSGDPVMKGQLLFELSNDTQQAEVQHRQALVRAANAELARLESWEREEDQRIAKAQWDEAEAMAKLAEYEKLRLEEITGSAASAKELTHARHNHTAALARAQAAKAVYDLSTAGPREEDLEIARAAVAEVEAQLAIARSMLAKTRVLSPINGIVIYRYREPGEVLLPDIPKPVLSIGDRETLHVRVDVDETDIARIQLGQKAFATVPAFEGKRFAGKVVHIEQVLGRKNFQTLRPTEKSDTKILEVVVALDAGDELPLDLQMTVWFLEPEDQ